MGSKINCIAGADIKAKSVIDWLVGIYESDANYFTGHGFNVQNPDSIVICYIEGVGGIVLDLIGHRGNGKFYCICQYLCIEERHRGKGHARELVEYAKELGGANNSRFVGAYVESGDQMKLWDNFGFKHQSNVGFTLTMFDQPSAELWN